MKRVVKSPLLRMPWIYFKSAPCHVRVKVRVNVSISLSMLHNDSDWAVMRRKHRIQKDDVVHFHVDPNARMFLAAILQIVCCSVTKHHSRTWEPFTRKSIPILNGMNATKMQREVGT